MQNHPYNHEYKQQGRRPKHPRSSRRVTSNPTRPEHAKKNKSIDLAERHIPGFHEYR
jgi:hypothetical protein